MNTEHNKESLPAPLLYRWDDIVLSFSASSQLSPHSHGAAELVIALQNPVCSNLGVHQVFASSILIPPTTEHQNQYTDPLTAVLYLDLESFCYKELSSRMSQKYSVYTDLPGEIAFQLVLMDIYKRVPSAAECYALVVKALLGGTAMRSKELDSRVATVVKTIKADPSMETSVAELAAQVKLSEDRLHHLFTTELGIPIHRYKVWLRLKLASKVYFSGRNLTYAALEAGFSDASHFSRTFTRMYGAAPSKLLTARRNSRVFFS